jgi:predicted nucleic acid-binding protein
LTKWLLDTNVISELRRPRPEPRVVSVIASEPLERLFVSAVTLAEIRFGIERVEAATKRAELSDWLNPQGPAFVRGSVLPVSEDVIFKWRVLVEAGRKARHTFTQPDLFIAATALHYGLTILSRDVADYERAKVPVLNPWRDLPQ